MKTRNYLEGNYLSLMLWVMLFLVLLIQIIPQTKSVLEGVSFVTFTLALSFPFVKYLSEDLLQRAMKTKKVGVFILQFFLFSIIIGGIFLAFLFLFSFLEKKHIFPASEYFNMDVPISMLFLPISAGVLINASICGIRFFQENLKLKKALIEYQLRTLQRQVTPHFMFNVLNHIHILMQTDVELASDLLIKYSEILRYQLYYESKKKVSLERDIQFLKDFIAIEELRWEEKLTITSTWNIENPEIEIPAMLFITFIENAFKYVSKSNFEKGYINIDFTQTYDKICLNVENSKSKISQKKETKGGLGLKNIKERLTILYFDKYDLSIEETSRTYKTKLTINI